MLLRCSFQYSLLIASDGLHTCTTGRRFFVCLFQNAHHRILTGDWTGRKERKYSRQFSSRSGQISIAMLNVPSQTFAISALIISSLNRLNIPIPSSPARLPWSRDKPFFFRLACVLINAERPRDDAARVFFVCVF